MRYKEYRLQKEIQELTKAKEFAKMQAKMSNYACIFAGTASGIATIVAIISAMDPQVSDDQTLTMAFFAFALAIAAHGAHGTDKQSKKQAEQFKKTITKRNRTLRKLTKTR